MAAPVNLRVHEHAVASFVLPGQPVSDLVWKVAQSTREIGRVWAPKRTGNLAASIRANRPVPHGPFQTSSLVYANARHALWVHEGTTGPIRAKNRLGILLVPKARGIAASTTNMSAGTQLYLAWKGGGPNRRNGRRYFFRPQSVRGQRSQPFLAEAMHMAMRVHT